MHTCALAYAKRLILQSPATLATESCTRPLSNVYLAAATNSKPPCMMCGPQRKHECVAMQAHQIETAPDEERNRRNMLPYMMCGSQSMHELR